MELKETILDLVRLAIKDLDDANLEIVGVVHKCIRISRITKDWENLLWLRMTLKDVEDQVTRHEIWDEIRPHLQVEELLELNNKNGQLLVSLRRIDDKMVAGFSLQDTIERIKIIENGISSHQIETPEISTALMNLKKIIFRTKDRLYDFLTKLEAKLMGGSLESDHYINNKLFIIENIEERSPELLAQLRAAEEDCNSESSEGLSHAALSCRRALKSIADMLWHVDKPQKVEVNGKKVELSEEKFINRLWQFLSENIKSKSLRGNLETEISSIGNRLEQVNSFASKGVHDYLTKSEVKSLTMRTHILIGDLLRIESDSVFEGEVEE
tara:strand:+ start:122 stop:1102 length:981 start_codon:yes stop_codon:yes gene_type:complete